MAKHVGTRLTVRYMTDADLDAVMEIEQLSFAAPWRRRAFKAELSMNRLYSHLLVGVEQEHIFGFICFRHDLDNAHIINFAVHPKYRRRGYGRWLLERCLERTRQLAVQKVILEVRVSNHTAIALYTRVGFVVLATRRRFYSDNGEDAYVMAYSHIRDGEISHDSVRAPGPTA